MGKFHHESWKPIYVGVKRSWDKIQCQHGVLHSVSAGFFYSALRWRLTTTVDKILVPVCDDDGCNAFKCYKQSRPFGVISLDWKTFNATKKYDSLSFQLRLSVFLACIIFKVLPFVYKLKAYMTTNKNSSGDEIANVNFLTTISHTRRLTSKYRKRDKPTSFNKLDDR